MCRRERSCVCSPGIQAGLNPLPSVPMPHAYSPEHRTPQPACGMLRPGRKCAFRGHGGGVVSVAFSPDGARVLTGSDADDARLWDVASGKLIRAFMVPIETPRFVAFSSDGMRVLTANGNTIYL